MLGAMDAQCLARQDLLPVRFSPCNILIPANKTFPALVSTKLDTPSETIGDPSVPPSLLYGTIYCLDLVPLLFWDDVRKICRSKGILG